jgi:hypothetical protein
MGTAFEPDGGLGLCTECHDKWARECPQTVHDVLKRKIGAKRYEELRLLSNETVKIRDWEFKDIRERLERQAK